MLAQSTALAILGLVVVTLGWLHYLALIPKERVPKSPHLHRLAMVIGVATAAFAVVRSDLDGGPVALLVIAAALAAFFFYLLARAKQPATTPTFSVGEQLPEIDATANAAGQRVFLKLFRGHW